MKSIMIKSAVAAALASACVAASAAPILFVSDSNTDLSIATLLSGAGHSVTKLIGQYSNGNTAALTGNLSGYAAVFWSATGTGSGGVNSNSAMYANLNNYVSAGGRVFVTGYDSIVSPTDTPLQNFLGGNGGLDTCDTPGTIANVTNSLTTGVVDIRGRTPGTTGGQTCDRDGLRNLTAGTVGIVASGNNLGYYQWTLRSLGAGEIAYVSNGNPSGSSAMWTNGSPYQYAVLNFAANAGQVPEPGTLALLGLGFAAIGAMRRRKKAK